MPFTQDSGHSPEKTAFLNLIQNNTIQTMHTQEATLEEIFLQLTGRRLS